MADVRRSEAAQEPYSEEAEPLPEVEPECPRCHTPSLTPRVGQLGEAACGRCRGRLLPPEAVDVVIVEQLGHPQGFLKELAAHFDSRGVVCALCEGSTSLVTLRGCTLDLCLRCGAAWLEEGELARLSNGRFLEVAPPPWTEPPPPEEVTPSSSGVPIGTGVAVLLAIAVVVVVGVQRMSDLKEPPPAPPPVVTPPSPTPDQRQRLSDLERRCDARNSAACVELVELYYRPGPARDLAAAARVYGTLCSAGSLIACSNLGHLNETGQGVPRDIPRAISLFEKACPADGDYRSCRRAGLLYERGEGVPRDLARARAHFENACIAAGDAQACEGLKRLNGG